MSDEDPQKQLDELPTAGILYQAVHKELKGSSCLSGNIAIG